MSVPVGTRAMSAPVRLRGLDVLVDVTVIVTEVERRAAFGLDLDGLTVGMLGSLLQIPSQGGTRLAALSTNARELVERRPWLVERVSSDKVRRRVAPVARVDMVTLCTSRWRPALRHIGRFAPYSARRLLLCSEPADLDLLRMEATYWGVGVALSFTDGCLDVVQPAPFEPQRYTGASWAFAEQAHRATRGPVSPWPPAIA